MRNIVKLKVGMSAAMVAMVSGVALSSGAPLFAAAPKAIANKAPISWWVPGPSPIPGTLHKVAQAFTKQTGIRVNVESTPWSTYLTKITTAITSGRGPDVLEIGNTWAATFARTGGFVSWTPAMFRAVGGRRKFLGTSMEVTGAPHKAPISVPFLGQTWLLEYNKQLFKRAHISAPPKTWNAFYLDAKKLSDPKKNLYGLAAPIGAPTADETWDWIMFRQEGGNYYTNGRPNLTSRQDVNTLSTFVKWVYPDRIINPALVADSTGTLSTTEFERGQAGMLLTQNPQQAISDPKKYGIGLIPLPPAIPAGGAPVMSHVAGENLAIFKNSKHLTEDVAFIKFLTSPKEQEVVNKNMYELPVTHQGLLTPYFQTPAEKIFGEILDKYARPMPTEASTAEVQNSIGSATLSLLRQDISSHGISVAKVRAALSAAEQSVLASGG